MTTAELAYNACVPCKGGVPPLTGDALEAMHEALGPGWELIEEHHLEKEYTFEGYSRAVAFTNAVAAIAEEQNHHPDIALSWGKVVVTIWTHKIDGLTESDFYFAAKVEEVYKKSECP